MTGRLMNDNELERILMKSVVTLIAILCKNLVGGTENYENSQHRLVNQARFEPSTSRIKVYIVTAKTKLLGR
jgi:hypothetical protein